MSELDRLDLKGFVSNSVQRVFQTMLLMSLTPGDPPSREQIADGRHIVGTVGFAGAVMGNVNLFVNLEFAREMTAAMLGISAEEVGGEEEVKDVVGEVCNMVGGDLKSRLCDAGFPCSLSIPTITCGEHFQIESKGWVRQERLGFQNSRHPALLEVYVKIST